MRQDQYELKGAVLEAPLEWQGLRLVPGRGGVLVTGLEGTDQRRFQRQLTVLKGYAALAADRRGERPLRLRQEDLPEREGPETLAAVWYGRAAEAEDQHGTLVACYNGFGALPGGFAAMEESLARWAGRPLGEKLLDYVQAVRREEGDLAEKAEPFQTCPAGRTGRRGSCCARCCGRCVRDLAGAGAPRDKGGAEWRSEPSSWNT